MADLAEAQSRYRIEGMDCAACAAKIGNAVRRVPGVEDVSVSVMSGTMTVRHAEGASLGAAIVRQVNALGGYRAAPLSSDDPNVRGAGAHASPPHDRGRHRHRHDVHDNHADHEEHRPADANEDAARRRSKRRALTIFCGLAIALAWIVDQTVPGVGTIAFAAAALIGLAPIGRRAVAAARTGTPFSIEMLMLVAAIGAILVGAAGEAAMVVFLFLVGELMEGVAARRAQASIRSLSDLVPRTARVERDGRVEEVAAARLMIGALILVRPGDRIAADGEIVEGEGAVDESPVSGESVAKHKGKGDTVLAGTINIGGVLRVRVTGAASDNTIARIVHLVQEAQHAKAPTERLIDRFSRCYTPCVVAIAALAAIVPPLLLHGGWGEWIYKGLVLLLIGCPCALVISTPAAIAAGLSAGARQGLLIKGGAVLEALGRITVMALDKTGTLTRGKPLVTDVIALGRDARNVIALATSLETGSSHPFAQAILDYGKAQNAPVPPAADVSAVGGKGVAGRVGGERVFLGSAAAAGERMSLPPDIEQQVERLGNEGKSVAVLLAGETVAGLIAMRDAPRNDAKEGLTALKSLGLKLVVLTGDNRPAAEAIGREFGVEVRAELLPQDKQRIVRELRNAGARVGKVGDGINDAPALAAADVGIAMGGGADVALETADAAVLHGQVLDLARMVALSRRVLANIHQNIAIAIGLKAVFLVTTLLGVTGLWPAILADTGATVLVTANALRLLAGKVRSFP